MGYPLAHRLQTTVVVEGTTLADPFRWLEDPASEDALDWETAQAVLATDVDTPTRASFREALARWWRPPTPTEAPAEPTPALIRSALAAAAGSTSIMAAAMSPSGEAAAAVVSSDGSDEWQMFVACDVARERAVVGPIDVAWGAAVAWVADGELWYSRPIELAASDPVARWTRGVFRHRLGTSPDLDELVFGAGEPVGTRYALRLSHDRSRVAVTTIPYSADQRVHIVATDSRAPLATSPTGSVVDTRFTPDGSVFAAVTDQDGSRVVRLREPDVWEVVAESTTGPIIAIEAALRHLVIASLDEAAARLDAIAVDGGDAVEVVLPRRGTVALDTSDGEVRVGYEDFTRPRCWYQFDDITCSLKPAHALPPTARSPELVVEQAFCRSRDGTRVPMWVVSPPGPLQPRPTIVHGYGDSGVAMLPHYQAEVAAWVERDGMWVLTVLRGGGEYGPSWAAAGRYGAKQNAIDDFVACCEWLIANQRTTSDMLGLLGGSAGGIVVGGAITQRPDLAHAAVITSGVLDLVRWRPAQPLRASDDSGGDPVTAAARAAVSPYHHVREGTAFPAVLLKVFGNDDRVDPAHSRKMCAALQHATTSARPVRYRVQAGAGHAGHDDEQLIDHHSDVLAFLWDQLTERHGLGP